MTPHELWKTLSPGRRSLAQDLADAALEGAGHETNASNEEAAAQAVAFKLYFLLWEGRRRRDD